MDLEKVIQKRRSIRRFQDREVPTDLIMKAIELASWAPSGGNRQPWKFFVVKNPDLIGRIADAAQATNDLIGS